MSTICFFPGQGSQKVGMADDFFHHEPSLTKKLFSSASEVCGFDIFRLCREGPEDELALTANAQPAILTTSVLAFRILFSRTGFQPSVVAGHSLGEYTALVASESMDFEDAVQVVRRRGELMQDAVPAGKGTMVAVIGLSTDRVEQMVHELASEGKVEIANLNASDQTVLSLESGMLSKVIEISREYGAKKTVSLNVSAPFHSTFMQKAAEGLEKVLQNIRLKPPVYRFISNVTGEYVEDSDNIRKLLVRQMVSPVCWNRIMKKLVTEGHREFVECGPGKVLSRLLKREYPETRILNVGSVKAVNRMNLAAGGGGGVER